MSARAVEGGARDGGAAISKALNDFTRISAEVRLARENLEITRLGGGNGSDPLAAAQKIARAEKNLHVAEAVQAKLAAGLRARGVDDPFAAATDHAWAEFKIARHQLAEARTVHDDLHPGPDTRPLGEGTSVAGAGKGKTVATPAQLEAGANLESAAARLDVAQGRLDDLGLDVNRLQAADDEALRLSLLERPRLLGGMRPTDIRQLGPDGTVHGYGRPLAGGLHLNLDVPAPAGTGAAAHAGPELGTVIDRAGTVIFRGEVTELGHGGFRISDPADAGLFREYDAAGQLTHAGLDVHGPAGPGGAAGVAAGRLEIDFTAGTATLHRPGQPAPDNFTYQPLPGGGHQITRAADGSWLRYDAAGNQTGALFEVRAGGLPAGQLEIDIVAGTGRLHRPGQAVPDNVAYQPLPGGGHQITRATDGSWQRFDAAGDLTAARFDIREANGQAAGHLETDLAAGTATLHRPGQPVPDNFTYQLRPGGGHQITRAADGSWHRFDHTGTRTAAGLDVRDPGGAAAGRLQIDFAGGTATLHRPGQPAPDNFTYQPLPGGGHQLTNAADNSTLRFDGAGGQTGAGLDVQGPAGAAAGRLEIDFTAGTATLHRPGQPAPDNFTYQAQPGGGHQITNAADGSWHRYDAAGNQTATRFNATDLGANPFGAVELDIVAGTGRHLAPGGAPRDWPTLQIGAGGELRLSNAAGEMQRYTPGGGLTDEIIAPRDPRGNLGPSRLHTTLNPAGNPVLELRHGGNPVPNTRVTIDGADYRITSTGPGPHGGDYRVIGHDGALHSERISFLGRKGQADGTHLSVDYRTNQWARQDGAGRPLAGHANAAPRAGLGPGHAPPAVRGYNSRGSVTVKANGDIELVGGDRTPFYARETLGNGNGHPRPTLEVFRGGDGRRYWHQWSGAADGTLGASAGRGTRVFEDLPEGRLWSDHQHGWPADRTVREYRRAADGGVIRAELQANGSWRWYRFDAGGQLTLEGVRDHRWLSTSWRDTYTGANGAQVVAQRYHSAVNFFPKALHYREYAVAPRPGGGFRTTDAFKEFSPQIKDTGTLDVLGNGNTLKTTRWAEQRPPDALWKTPAGLPGRPIGKAVSHLAGSKLGAVDFPARGSILGDSRYQVFRWTETDAHGAQVATGVRAITPEGSFSDFTRDGLFVRGAIKLENGNTVEIGRAANGKWASLDGNLPAAGARTLDWREIDSAKNVVANGERHFLADGKHWVDGTATGAPAGQLRVVRHTDAAGNVVSTVGAGHRPLFNPRPPGGHGHGPFAPVHTGQTITRNTMGQIVGRSEQWLSDAPLGAGQAGPARITVEAAGDARTGRWRWDDGTNSGVRTSGRNERWSGSWDDSYRDFRTDAAGVRHQIRDVRALGKGTSLTAQRMPDGTWRAEIRGADGTPVPNSAGTRQFSRGDGTWAGNAPPGTGQPRWRDVDANGHVLRELVDGRVRQYTNPRPANAPAGTGAWKEFDQGAVFRERVDSGGGVFRETESFHKQWRETDASGRLLRYRSLSGTVWERGPLNRWSIQHRNFEQVGREFEFRGGLSEFRGKNRMWRESNRLQYKAIDGLAGEFVSPTRRILQKAALDFSQEFVLDFTAQVLIGLAFNQGQLNPQDWFRALVGAGIASGIKTGNSVYHDSSALGLKGVKDGLANVDGGKDFNRNPYNHDKHWDNEWGGTENPPRWRQTTYDYFQSTIAVNFVAAFVANAVNAAAFGLPKDYVPLAGGAAALAGAWGGAGTLVVSSTLGGARALAHQLGSGRYFHRGGLADIGLSFVERLGERAMGTYLLLTAAGLRPQDNIPAPPPVVVPPAPPPM
ncbi:hypothetical protein CcI49_05300 [Frankia sp. CcI49]|uniref:hypothetical protein n=1 Tax=Frankia sp. CcI49 TaxID=1745382 RepID=UPI0009772BFE|nr:hypothetical protein [Frankia sp. CcI49]ONH61626.1 hypothetical protein CcI49_05300 [Frankia sp. CcI49]